MQHPLIVTERELQVAINAHSFDNSCSQSDSDMARSIFEWIGSNRGTHPSLPKGTEPPKVVENVLDELQGNWHKMMAFALLKLAQPEDQSDPKRICSFTIDQDLFEAMAKQYPAGDATVVCHTRGPNGERLEISLMSIAQAKALQAAVHAKKS